MNKDDFPEKYRKYFEVIYAQLHWLELLYRDRESLFATEQRRNLLQEAAPLFFHKLQRVINIEIYLIIARLTDEPTTGEDENLSIKGLSAQLKVDYHFRVARSINKILGSISEELSPVRNVRNKLLSHLDARSLQNNEPNKLLEKDALELLINKLFEAFNVFTGSFADTGVAFDLEANTESVESILNQIKDAKRYRELVDSGKIDKFDFMETDYYSY